MKSWFNSPETVHVFLSYTAREHEVQLLQPLVDEYCATLWLQARSRGLDVFYDHFSLEQRWYDDDELEALLKAHISLAHLFVGFVSPAYVESRWCCYEWKKGPMRKPGWFTRRRLPTQGVYWKPDYHEANAYDESVVYDLDSRDLTVVWHCVSIPRAAQVAADEALRLLSRAVNW